jgi:hypothetical protein
VEILDGITLKRLPWDKLKLCFLGDVQYGSEGCNVPLLRKVIDEALEQDAWFAGMGDMHDFLSPSNRKKLMSSGLYDTAERLIEEWAMKHVEELKEILRPTKGRWIGMVEGHHFYEFTDGSTTDTELCRFLESPFLGTTGMVRLQFVKQYGDAAKTRAQVTSCDIWMHHGSGGGSTAGAPLNTLEKKAASFHADIYAMGHQSKLGTTKVPYLELTGGGKRGKLKVRNKTKTLVATGSFLEGYCVGSTAGRTGRARGGYVEQRMLTPTTLGAPLVTVTPKQALVDRQPSYGYLDIRAEV